MIYGPRKCERPFTRALCPLGIRFAGGAEYRQGTEGASRLLLGKAAAPRRATIQGQIVTAVRAGGWRGSSQERAVDSYSSHGVVK